MEDDGEPIERDGTRAGHGRCQRVTQPADPQDLGAWTLVDLRDRPTIRALDYHKLTAISADLADVAVTDPAELPEVFCRAITQEGLARAARVCLVAAAGAEPEFTLAAYVTQFADEPDITGSGLMQQAMAAAEPIIYRRSEGTDTAAVEVLLVPFGGRSSTNGVAWLARAGTDAPFDQAELSAIVGLTSLLTQARRRPAGPIAGGTSKLTEEVLAIATEVARVGLWDWDIKTGRVVWSDEHFRMEGYEPGEIQPSFEAWADGLHPADRTETIAALQQCMEGRHEFVHEFRSLHADGTVRWLYGRGRFFHAEDGEPARMIGAVIDTTDRRLALEGQRARVSELQGRIRNLLAVVRHAFARTMATSTDLDSAAMHFAGRLDALARNQLALARSAQGTIDLEELVRDELLSIIEGSEPQTVISGPPVQLDRIVSQYLTLAIHELAVNAMKHGAFSISDGMVEISWDVNMGDRGIRVLRLHWEEKGVPIVQVVGRRKGFGTEVIEEIFPLRTGAEIKFASAGGGISCSMVIPLERSV